MKVVVLGAGQVGSSIARYLAAENNDVTVVDQSPELIQKLADTLDVKAIAGYASHPDVLQAAGAAQADMLVAVTLHDEVNMVACQIGHSLFDVPTRIARVRARSYLKPIWSKLFRRDHIPIDVIISPEHEVAKAIGRRMRVPGAFDMLSLAEGKVRVVGVRCTQDTPILYTPLKQLTTLFPDLAVEVVAIIRQDTPIIPDSEDQMLPGDEVYFVAATHHLSRAMAAFGYGVAEARRVVIIGGGNVGSLLAEEIETSFKGVSARVIESGRERAARIAQHLERTPVLLGDGMDPEILDEANIAQAEAVVTVTNEDKVNILAGLLAKRYGAKRAIALVNQTTYTSLVTSLGIDAVVNPRTITVSRVLENVRRGRIKAVQSLRDGFAEIIEAEALETSSIVHTPLKQIRWPEGVIVGAVLRNDEVMMPRPSTVLKPHDRVIILAAAGSIKKVERLFSVRLEYF